MDSFGCGSYLARRIQCFIHQYKKLKCGDKTILWPTYIHTGISFTGKNISLHWIRALFYVEWCSTISSFLPTAMFAVPTGFRSVLTWHVYKQWRSNRKRWRYNIMRNIYHQDIEIWKVISISKLNVLSLVIWITLSLSVSSQFVALGLRARVINCDSYNQTNVYFVFIFYFRSKQFQLKPESLSAMNTILLFRRPCNQGRMAIFSRPFVWYRYHWKVSTTSASTGQVTYCRELRYVNKFRICLFRAI